MAKKDEEAIESKLKVNRERQEEKMKRDQEGPGEERQDVPTSSGDGQGGPGGGDERVQNHEASVIPYQRITYLSLKSATSDFHPQRLVGEGTFGQVYRCQLSGIAVQVAVKVFAYTDDAQSKDAFEKEAHELSKSPHPNIVQMIGTSVDGPHLCLVTKYMAGGSAQDRLSDGNPLTWRERLVVADAGAQALFYLHSQLKTVHRDVKASNLLLDKPVHARKAVLCDFGLTRTLNKSPGKTERTGTIVGTTAYMSYEAMQGKITPKMDIFAMGVTLLVLMTGRPAEGGANAGDHPLQIEMEDALEELVEGDCKAALEFVDTRLSGAVPPEREKEEMLRLAQKCLQHKYKDRPEASALRDTLQPLLMAAEDREDLADASKSHVSVRLSLTAERQHWESTRQRGMDDVKVFPVAVASVEFNQVASLFNRTLPHAVIDKMERIENGVVHEAFCLQAATMQKQIGAQWDAQMRRLLFHGTHSDAALKSIINSVDGHGFLPLLSGSKVGAKFGDGTYYARDSRYSNDYAFTLPNGQKQMLVVDVLVGRWTLGQEGTKMPPLLPGERYSRYNSLVNQVDDPSIFVIQHSNQAYPKFLITYHV